MAIDYTTIPRLRLLQVDSTGSPNGNNLSPISNSPVIPIYGFTFVDINNNPISLSGSGGGSSSIAWSNVTGKPVSFPTTSTQITDTTTLGQGLLTANTPVAIRTLIGAGIGNSNFSGSYTDLTSIPTILPTVSTLIQDATTIGKSILVAADAATVRGIIGTGASSGTTSVATQSITGTVKINSAAADPLVYLKTDVDTLISNLQTQVTNNTSQISRNVVLGGVLTGIPSNPNLRSTGVTAGSYNYANVTVDFDGRITNITANNPQIYKTPLQLPDAGGVVSLNASLVDYNGVARITLVGNRSLACSNFTDGQTIHLEVTQGGSGSYTLALPSNVVYNTNLTSITLSTAIGLTDVIVMRYRGTSNKLLILNFIKGFSN